MTKHGTHTVDPAASEPWMSMTAWNGPMMAAFSRAGTAYAKGCIEWQQEVARFIGARLEEDRRAQQSLCECRSFDDMAKIQQSWIQTAAKAYAAEAENLTQIASRWAQGAAPSIDEGRKARHDEK